MKPVDRELAMKPAGRDLAMKPVLGVAIKPWTGVPSPSQAHCGGVVARAIKPRLYTIQNARLHALSRPSAAGQPLGSAFFPTTEHASVWVLGSH